MSSATQTLLAGTSRRCTNPPPNIAHGGWGAQKHEQAEGIDLDFWVTALALSDGQTTAIILDIDLQILTNERADQIRAAVSRATSLPVESIRASVTHTHSGPVPYKSWIEKGFELVGPWFDDLARWCAEAAVEALANWQPVAVRAGQGECRINTNRRCTTPGGDRFLGVNPAGPCDHGVGVVQLTVPGGGPLATLVNYACHPTIMGPTNRLLTPDYPGAMKRVVEAAVGGRCVFLQGAAGNVGPVQGFQGDPRVYRQLGAVLGHEVARIALALTCVPSAVAFREIIPSGAPLGLYDLQFAPQTGCPVRVSQVDISVPVRAGLPEKKAATEKLAHWKSRLTDARASHDAAAIAEATVMARRADLQLRMADDFGGRSSAAVRTHVVTFGEVALVGCNIEPFCEIGLAIKRQSPFPVTFMGGYTNGRMAYLPTADEWAKGGYEVDNSPFGPGAAECLQQEILALLRRLRGPEPTLG
ncbi:MAG: hypothetical protein EXS37_18900 [Opitutus sp.]|nr:hypothetical protein [Opitutus sp.]